MIRIRIKGRLGNQLFIYSFARALSEKYGQKVLIYDRTDEDDPTWHSHLSGFKLNYKVTFTNSKREILKLSPLRKKIFVMDRLCCLKENNRQTYERQMRNMKRNLKHGLILLGDGFFELPERMSKEIFCDGYFQSAKYFDWMRKDILKEIVPTEVLTDKEKDFIYEIENCESVCLTIRLGDYINNSKHQVCTKEFYLNAISKMMEFKPNCKLFVFSDEVDKVKKIFDFKYPVVYSDKNSSDCISLYMMSKCKDFIISNSSFSWWAQYLSQNEHKLVISPDRWYAADIPCDIMQDSWIKLYC